MISALTKTLSFNSRVIITPIPTNNHCSFSSSPFRLKFPLKRRRSRIQASSLLLPLLPFPIEQVFVPSETKTLHLYEARYIALLEKSLSKNKLFVHFVVDPSVFGGTSVEASAAALYGCLVVIEKVERVEYGALILIRGISRVKLLSFVQIQPYLTGEVIPVQDDISSKLTEIISKLVELKEALMTLNSLEIKLKTPGESLLQTQITNSLLWAEKKVILDDIENFVPLVAERVSFAPLQAVSGASQSELRRLQKEKLRAMDTKDTLERMDLSMELVRNNISMVAAKLAIQSIGVP